MNAIGGYLELELRESAEFHRDVIRLNTGRNCLEYILKARAWKKIFLPWYACDALREPVDKLGLAMEFYHIDHRLEPIFNYSEIGGDSCFLYINYFGLKDVFIEKLVTLCPNLIIDNAQAFYSPPSPHIDSFYSPRKFFGVPDGGYVYCEKTPGEEFEQDHSADRFEHLLLRSDKDAESGYAAFTKNEERLKQIPVRKMSALTRKLLSSIDYESVRKKRVENYLYLDQELKSANLLQIPFDRFRNVPLVYPFLAHGSLRETLANNRIYTAFYWPNVPKDAPPDSFEAKFANEIISLPVDQRMSSAESEKILRIIKNEYKR